MSRPLRLNDKEIEDISALLQSNLKKITLNGLDKLNLSLPVPTNKTRAKLIFSSIAWTKMYWLVQEFKGEIEWHGLIVRTGKHAFFVKDILTFPHEVSSVSVISDQKEYTDWLESLPQEQRQELFFHGHSHVNMRVLPSSVDTKYRSDIIGNIGVPRPGTDEDIFYAFIILNKHGDWSAQLFDVTNNIVYDTEDIDIDVLCEDGTNLSDFLAKTKSIVKEKKPALQYFGNPNSFAPCKEKGQSKPQEVKRK